MKPINRNLRFSLLAGITLASSAAYGQGTFTTDTTTAPTFDGADQGYFNPNMPSTAPGRDKWFYENSGAGQQKGQSFTTTGDISVKAVTYRLGSTNKPPTCDYLVRLGVIDTATNTFYPLHSETITQSNDWGIQGDTTNAYGTWTLETPVELPGLPTGTVYGFDITFTSNTTGWRSGIPYPLYENSDVFEGGARFTAPLGGAAGIPTNNLQIDSGRDREFHVDMDAATITDTTAPTIASDDIVDNAGGEPIYADQSQILYTLTFDDAIDPSTIDLTDFENLGSGVSLVSLDSVTVTTPFPVASVVDVLFTISGTGTLNLGIAAGTDITDFYTNTLTAPVADDTTITVSPGTTPDDGNYYWDGTTVGGTGNGASDTSESATWDTTTANWDPGFALPRGPWTDSTANTAFFNRTSTGNHTISLDADRTLGQIDYRGTVSTNNMFSIGDVGEDNVLNFGGAATITTDDYYVTINAGITGAPTINYDGRQDNNTRLVLQPTAPNTMTLGSVNLTNNGGSNKNLYLGGDSSGNVVDEVTWAVTNNQLHLRKSDTSGGGADGSSWTITQNYENRNPGPGGGDSRVTVEEGTLIFAGTYTTMSHKTEIQSGGRLSAQGSWDIYDPRNDFEVQNGGIVSPGGTSVDTLTVSWSENRSDLAEVDFQNGSTLEWQVGAGNTTDVLAVALDVSPNLTLLVESGSTLKVIDAGGTPSAGDKLTVFTCESGVTYPDVPTLTSNMTIDISGTTWTGTPTWGIDVDGGTGDATIYVTGISSGVVTPPFDTWAGTGTLPGTVTFEGDLNGDGVQDGIAFLLGVANPDNDANGNLPTVSEDGSGNLVMVFNCLATADRGTAQLRVGHSNTLASFTATADVVPDADGTDTDGKVSYVVDTVSEAPLNKVTATIDSSVAAGGKLFGRLQATE